MSKATTKLVPVSDEKLWGRAKPIHRIGLPPELTKPVETTGDALQNSYGYLCGCRHEDHDMADMTASEFFEDAGQSIFAGLVGGVVLGLVGAAAGGILGGAIGGIADAAGADLDAKEGAEDGALWLGGILGGLGFIAGVAGWAYLKTVGPKKLLVQVPAWVHVENTRKSVQDIDDELEREIEGEMVKAHQSRMDNPIHQLHHYFDWCFHIRPEEGFRHIGGTANVTDYSDKLEEDPRLAAYHEQPRVECEWDVGAFAAVTAKSDGALYSGQDLGWPMPGQHVWLAGRWIYDCGHGHTNELISEEEREKDWKKSDLFKAELHPVKAVASARWQGVKFAENRDKYVPGIRFTFFASRRGGYFEFKDLTDKDYEFIVDLPRHPSQHKMVYRTVPSSEYDKSKTVVGLVKGHHAVPKPGSGQAKVHTRNTELLMRMVTEPFNNPGFGKAATITPIVEPIENEHAKAFPSQVKI